MMDKDSKERYSSEETEQRREAALRRMLATPPKPHSETKIGKLRGKSMTPKGVSAQSKKKRPTDGG